MLPLLQKEFMQEKKHLLQILGFLAVAALLFGRNNPSMLMSYFMVFPIVIPITVPQLSLASEERENTFAFLRALPIPPGEIVAAKYVFTAIVVAMIELLLLGSSTIHGLPASTSLSAVSATTVLALLLSSVSLLLHFWLGVKSAQTVLRIGILVLMLPVVSAVAGGGADSAVFAKVSAWAGSIMGFAGTAAGLAAAVAVGALCMVASWAIATRIFASRDLSRLV